MLTVITPQGKKPYVCGVLGTGGRYSSMRPLYFFCKCAGMQKQGGCAPVCVDWLQPFSLCQHFNLTRVATTHIKKKDKIAQPVKATPHIHQGMPQTYTHIDFICIPHTCRCALFALLAFPRSSGYGGRPFCLCNTALRK